MDLENEPLLHCLRNRFSLTVLCCHTEARCQGVERDYELHGYYLGRVTHSASLFVSRRAIHILRILGTTCNLTVATTRKINKQTTCVQNY